MTRRTLLGGCLLAGALAAFGPGQAAGLDARVRTALTKSRPILLDRLGRARNGELALLCLAAIHDEVPAKNKILAKALRRLQHTRLSRTYDLALRLMVAAECPSFPSRKQTAVLDKRRLITHLRRGVGFGYDKAGRGWDLSNTQYAILGLRAAVSLGVKVEQEHWQSVMHAATSTQGESGGFGYSSGLKPTASMTVAGIAILQVCSSYVDKSFTTLLGVAKRTRRGWQWLADHKGEIGDRKTGNSFYFHYGLERAAILSDVTEVGGKDWYVSGAEMLLRTQRPNGGWHSDSDMVRGKAEDGADSVSTSFAILFLRRKFQKTITPGPLTIGGGIPIHLLPVGASPEQQKTAVETAVRRGRSALPQVLRALGSAHKNRRVAAAKAMIRITGMDFGYSPHRTVEKNREAIKKAELWYLKSRRTDKK